MSGKWFVGGKVNHYLIARSRLIATRVWLLRRVEDDGICPHPGLRDKRAARAIVTRGVDTIGRAAFHGTSGPYLAVAENDAWWRFGQRGHYLIYVRSLLTAVGNIALGDWKILALTQQFGPWCGCGSWCGAGAGSWPRAFMARPKNVAPIKATLVICHRAFLAGNNTPWESFTVLYRNAEFP